jgi:hypothetical protein
MNWPRAKGRYGCRALFSFQSERHQGSMLGSPGSGTRSPQQAEENGVTRRDKKEQVAWETRQTGKLEMVYLVVCSRQTGLCYEAA